MRNLTYCLEMGQGVKSLRGSDRGFDCRLTVVRPSSDRRFRALKVLTVLLLILTMGVGNVFGDELTVADGTQYTNGRFVPLYGNYDDDYQHVQILYPSSLVGSMNGTSISSVSFYLKTKATKAFKSTYSIRLLEVANASVPTSYIATTGSTLVYEGLLDARGNLMTVTFDTPFEYSGGNLLFDLQTKIKVASGYSDSYFYGVNQDANLSTSATNASSVPSSGTGRYFLPKTTFTFEEAATGGCAKPKALTQGTITATSATFTWTAGGEETSWQWVCLPAATAVDWSSPAVQTVTSATATATGLSAETDYKFYVRADCGSGQSTEVSKSFTTTCAGASLPFTENFDEVTTSIPNCWGRIAYSYYGSDYPYVYSSGGRTGKGLYFYGGASSSSSIIILPPFEVATNTLSLSFWYKSSVDASYGKLKVGYMTNPADASTFVVLPEGTLNQTSTWTEVQEFSLASAPASSFIAIQYSGGSSAYGTGYIDDISVSVASACKKPASLTATAASATSIDLSWTAKGEESAWQVQYRVGAGAWSSPVEATTNPFTLTDLTAQTTYEIQVRANCGGEQSDWSASAEATTLCAAQTGIGFAEDFEGVQAGYTPSYDTYHNMPDCWMKLTNNDYPNYPFVKNAGGVNDSQSLDLYGGKTTTQQIAVLPQFTENTDELTISFKYKVSDKDGYSKYAKLQVGYYKNGTFTALYTLPQETSLSDFSKPMTGAPSDARIAIALGGEGVGYNNEAFVDNIVIIETPSCVKPDVPTITSSYYDGASLDWAEYNGKNAWLMQYSTDGETWTPANSGENITSKPFVLRGLTPGTEYQVQVRTVCAENENSEWSNAVSFTPNYVAPTALQVDATTAHSATISWTANSGESSWTVQYKKASDGDWTTVADVTVNPYTITSLTSATTYQVRVAAGTIYTSALSFTTDCETKALPFVEDFSAFTCWTKDANCHASSGVNDGAFRFFYKSSAPYEQTIISPELLATSEEVNVEFEYKVYSSNYPETFALGYSTATNDVSSFTWLADETVTNTAYATYTKTLPANIKYVAIQCKSEDKYYLYIDNFSVKEKPACANPSKPAISNVTASSAVVTWTSEASGFALQYKKGAGEWQDAAGTIVSPYTLNGLDEQSTYTVQVKAICGVGNESEFVASDAFTTNCAEKELGYEMAFGATLDACWDNSVYGNSSQWNISSESTNYYMRYATNNNISCYGVLQTPAIIVPSNKETIARFQWQNTGATASLKVSVDGAEPEDVTTDLSNVTSGWVTKDISLSDYKGHSVVLYFRGQYDAAKNKYLYLDDFTVIEKPCETPTGLAAAATSTGATITWTAGGDESQWNLHYREIAEPENAWTLEENVTTGYAITGLEVGHNYEVQVQAYCDATHQSDWTASANFTPVCGAAPTNLAVSARTTNSATLTWEGVESAFALQTSLDGEAWEDAINVNAKTYDLTGLTAGTTYYVRVQNHCGGEYATASFTTWCGFRDAAELPLDITNFTAVPECWEVSFKGEYSGIAGGKICFYGTEEQMAVLPAYDIDLNKLSVTFTYSLNGTADFGYLDEPNGTFHAFASQPTSGVELNLAGEATGAKYIAIRYNGSSSMLISGVQLRKTPTCNKPTGVTAVPSVGSATIDWTSDAEAWKLQYKTGSEDWTEVSVAEKPYEITGLTQGINYKVRVQATCAGDELSDWSDEVDFTTSCSGIDAIPYYADFTETLSSCWAVFAQDESYYKPTVNTAMQQLTMNGGKNGASNNVVVMPPFSADLTNAVLSFEYSCSTGANNAQLEVGYITDKADVATFTTVETLAKSSSWVEARVPATSFGGNYIAFRYAGGSSHGDLAIRNLRMINQLVLEDDVDNSATIAANNGQTLDIQIDRTITCTGYFNTICLPFSLPTLDGTPLEGAELWAFKYAKVENEELLFRIVEASSIEAGKPYFIQFAAGDPIENPLFKNVTISATAGQHIGDASVAQLCGILQPEIFVPGDKTKLFLYNENALYWWNGDHNSQLKSFRAYFYVNTTSGANNSPIRHGMIARIIKEEQTATGVDNVQGDNVQCIKMIENDQIVIIKNGVKYNVQGQVISK